MLENRLSYQDDIVNDLKNSPNGGLLLISKGLGLYQILTKYFKEFEVKLAPLILLINFSDKEIMYMQSLQSKQDIQIQKISHLIQDKRSQQYLQGGIFAVTNITLIFDLLSQKFMPIEAIKGLIINNCESISSYKDPEPWLTTLIRQKNSSAFILGLSQKVEIISGRNNVSDLLKYLYLNKIFCWPNCRLEVQKSLHSQKNDPENEFQIVQYDLNLSKEMLIIQECLMKIIKSRYLDLCKRSSATGQPMYFSESEICTQSVSGLVNKIQQNKDFQINLRDNQLAKDIFSLRCLLFDLINLDCIAFWRKINRLKDEACYESIWFIQEAKIQQTMDKLFKAAKKRIFSLKKTKILLQQQANPEQAINKDVIQNQPKVVDEGEMNETGLNLKTLEAKYINISQTNKNQINKAEEANQPQDKVSKEEIQLCPQQLIDDCQQNGVQISLLSNDCQQNSVQMIQQQPQINKEDLNQNESKSQLTQITINVDKCQKAELPILEQIYLLSQKLKCQRGTSDKEKIQQMENEQQQQQQFNNQQQQTENNFNSAELLQSILEKDNVNQGKQEQEQQQQQTTQDNNTTYDQQDSNNLQFEVDIPFQLKLQLNSNPKLELLQKILLDIKNKYGDKATKEDQFRIWIYTKKQQKVCEIETYLQNVFLKKDSKNFLNMLEQLRYMIQDNNNRSFRLTQILNNLKKNKKQIEKKFEAEPFLLEQLSTELNLLFNTYKEFQMTEVIQQENQKQVEENKKQVEQNNSMQNDQIQNEQQQDQSSINFNDNHNKECQDDQQQNASDIQCQSTELQKLCILPQQNLNNLKNQQLVQNVQQQSKSFLKQQLQQQKINFQPITKISTQQDKSPLQNQQQQFSSVEIDKAKKNTIQQNSLKRKKFQLNEQIKPQIKHIKLDNIDLDVVDEYNDNGELYFHSEKILDNFQIFVNSLKDSAERHSFIKEFQPNFVILFEPSVSIQRELLLAQYQQPQNPLYQVCAIMYYNSIESEIFLNKVKTEEDAFEKIVKEKISINLELPETRIKKIDRVISSRIGGLHEALQPRIIIDKREFKSQLPSVLFHEGFQIIPMQLLRGDYILSDNLAIERKAVQTGDLIESLKIGKLEKQLKRMSKCFEQNFLLIEFSENLKFSLDSVFNYQEQQRFFINSYQKNNNDENNTYQQQQQSLKRDMTYIMSLLSAKFPKVKILWSQSPEQSAKYFKKFKLGKPEPNLDKFLQQQDEIIKKDIQQSSLDEFLHILDFNNEKKIARQSLKGMIKNDNEL